MLLVAIGAFETTSLIRTRNKASNENTSNFLPTISIHPLTKAYANKTYSSQIQAIDKDNEQLTYSLECPISIQKERCEIESYKHPSDMKINNITGELEWKVPSDKEGIEQVDIFIYDKYDYLKYTYSIFIENKAYYLREFISIPSSGKININEKISFRAILESDIGIQEVKAVFYQEGKKIHEIIWQFNSSQTYLILDNSSNPSFSYIPKENIPITVEIEVKTSDNKIGIDRLLLGLLYEDVYAGEQIIVNPNGNQIPIFDPLTDPYNSNVIKVNETYNFVLKASDPDLDNISYTVTTKPEWISVTTSSPEQGKINFSFLGKTNKAGSYMISITINDGLPSHFVTKTWPIVVQSDAANDNPIVTISSPKSPITITQKSSIDLKWSGSDNNQIIKYNLYYTYDSSNRSLWTKFKEFDNSYVSYSWYVNLPNGTYYVIIEAIDNQSPSGIGYSVTPSITVNIPEEVEPDPDEPDDEPPIVIVQPIQILEFYPLDGDIEENPVTFSATLIPEDDKEVDLKSIVVEIDNTDISQNIKQTTTTNKRVTISFTFDDLKDGEHKIRIYFKSTEGKEIEQINSFKVETSQKVVEKKKESNILSQLKTIFTNKIVLFGMLGTVVLVFLLLIAPLLFKKRTSSKEYSNFQISTNTKTVNSEPLNVLPITPSTSELEPIKDEIAQQTPELLPTTPIETDVKPELKIKEEEVPVKKEEPKVKEEPILQVDYYDPNEKKIKSPYLDLSSVYSGEPNQNNTPPTQNNKDK